MENLFEKYAHRFSENRLLKKIGKYARQMGLKTVYSVLLLYFAFTRKETPAWAKNIIIGVLGYVISPIDLIPDLTPVIGYTDDLGALSFGIVTIACYINQEVREKARKRLKSWFGDYDLEDLAEVDKQL